VFLSQLGKEEKSKKTLKIIMNQDNLFYAE